MMEYTKLVEATIEDLKRKQDDISRLHSEFYSRVEAVNAKGGIRLVGMDKDGWTFNVKSVTQHDKTGKPEWYEIRVSFEGVPEVMAYYAKNRTLWKKDQTGLNVRDLAEEVLYNVDVKIKCSCPADLYWGGQYIRSQKTLDANLPPKEERPPVERNPKQHGAFCKHIQAVINLLPMYGGTFSKWLKEYQGNHIGAIERDVRKEGYQVKDKAEEIQNKKEEQPKTEAERQAREKTSESIE